MCNANMLITSCAALPTSVVQGTRRHNVQWGEWWDISYSSIRTRGRNISALIQPRLTAQYQADDTGPDLCLVYIHILHFPDTPVGAQKWTAKLLPVRVRTSKLPRNSYVTGK